MDVLQPTCSPDVWGGAKTLGKITDVPVPESLSVGHSRTNSACQVTSAQALQWVFPEHVSCCFQPGGPRYLAVCLTWAAPPAPSRPVPKSLVTWFTGKQGRQVPVCLKTKTWTPDCGSPVCNAFICKVETDSGQSFHTPKSRWKGRAYILGRPLRKSQEKEGENVIKHWKINVTIVVDKNRTH